MKLLYVDSFDQISVEGKRIEAKDPSGSMLYTNKNGDRVIVVTSDYCKKTNLPTWCCKHTFTQVELYTDSISDADLRYLLNRVSGDALPDDLEGDAKLTITDTDSFYHQGLVFKVVDTPVETYVDDLFLLLEGEEGEVDFSEYLMIAPEEETNID